MLRFHNFLCNLANQADPVTPKGSLWLSLRRAFRIAGAQTVVASHWKVSDPATSQLMMEFMRRWRAGEPRANAWGEAQLSLLHSKSKEFANPYFWAAFTLTGRWR